MDKEDKIKISFILTILLPAVFWLTAVKKTEYLGRHKLADLWHILQATHTKPILWGAALAGLLLAVVVIWLLFSLDDNSFGGASFRRFIRGTKMVSAAKLKRLTKEKKKQQVTVATIPMPTRLEPFHLLINGATGAGKSILLRELAFTALKRGDRMIFIDPNGDMLSKFFREGDKILNPYDKRTEGWKFFNEIRAEYDFQRYALSLVPRGKTDEAEEWAGYARLLLREIARKLSTLGTPSVSELFRWATIAPAEELREFLAGTYAESLFAGSNEASKALTSARFVLSDKLPEHVAMPDGNFSIRDWLEDPHGGNLFITWREDMQEALKPLISAWVDVICTSILSMPEDPDRRIWLQIDEIASLEKLPSLEAALTKGRKHGLRIAAGLQSTSQLDDIYGPKMAITLRACFRNLVVLGGSRTDSKTNEDMSVSLGEHEVERDRSGRTVGKNVSTNKTRENTRERVVLPAEIANLPELTGYVAFAGDHPIAKIKLEYVKYRNRTPAFEEGL